MFRCISRLTDQIQEGNFFVPLLRGVVGPHVPFFFFGPNLLRKAVRVEGTQEGIVGTKHSQE